MKNKAMKKEHPVLHSRILYEINLKMYVYLEN